MRVLLKLTLECAPDAAWQAIRSPEVFRAVSWPFTVFTSLEEDGFPDAWTEGEHAVAGNAFGLLPVGTQIIDLRFTEPQPGVRAVIDSGRGVSGGLSVVTKWHHTMAVSARPDGRTLFRDQLRFEAGAATLALWPAFWAFWQWRGSRITRLARHWDAAAQGGAGAV